MTGGIFYSSLCDSAPEIPRPVYPDSWLTGRLSSVIMQSRIGGHSFARLYEDNDGSDIESPEDSSYHLLGSSTATYEGNEGLCSGSWVLSKECQNGAGCLPHHATYTRYTVRSAVNTGLQRGENYCTSSRHYGSTTWRRDFRFVANWRGRMDKRIAQKFKVTGLGRAVKLFQLRRSEQFLEKCQIIPDVLGEPAL